MSPSSAAPMDKAPEAFRTISEVAAELDLPQHVLRFWESRFVQIRPVKRAGGRRYYRPQEIDLLRGIKRLLYGDGFTIKGVQKLLRERGARYVTEIGRNAALAQPNFAFDSVVAAPGGGASALSEEKREKLEMLLAELVGMKRQLRAAASDLGV